jgi:hypothetical protein
VAKKEQERDWDKELAEVDRLLNQLPSHREEQQVAAAAAKRPQIAPGAGAAPDQGGSRLGTWARVALGLLVGIGMPLWPYEHGCGLKLFLYLGGVLTVVVAGVWSSLSSWKRRMGVAHVLSQLLVIWGLVLAARVVLPRVGYAKDPATWFCP